MRRLLLPLLTALLLAGCAHNKTVPVYVGPSAKIPPIPQITGNPDCRRYSLDISRYAILCTVISETPIILDGRNTQYMVYEALEDTLDDAGHVIVPAKSLFFGTGYDATGNSVAICRFQEFRQKDWTLAQGVTPAYAKLGDRVSLYLSFLAVPIIPAK